MDCEVLRSPDICFRGQKMLGALVDAAEEAGVRVFVNETWQRKSMNLMSYGLGHPIRRHWTQAHLRRGGRLIGWDLGYWNRDVPLAFNMRLTIDADHPHRWITSMPGDRFEASGIELREDADPDGPIVLCGLGQKQRALKGFREQDWERRTLAAIRATHPRRLVVYRPKRRDVPLPGCRTAEGPIEDAIRGASLIVCSHSNVAVDGCIAGVPVHCDDGAALALYRDNPAPTREQRLDFLRSLAWWQWNPTEAIQAWQFIRARLCV